MELAFDADEVEFAKNEVRILDGIVGALVDDNMGAVVFVQALEARREIDGVAKRGVAVAQRRAHVANASDTSVEAYADVETRLAFGFPLFLQLADALHHIQRRFAGAIGVARLLERCAPEGHHGVTDVLVERAVAIENDTRHVRKIKIKKVSQVLRVEFFGNRSEAANIAEHDADFGFARLHELWV